MVEMIFAHPENVTTFTQQVAYIDGLMNGYLGTIMLVVIFAVFFLMMKAFKTESAFAVASFITAALGIMIRVIFPVSDRIIYISIILALVGLLLIRMEASNIEG